MQGLKQTIINKECLKASLLIARYFQTEDVCIEHYLRQVADWAEQAKLNPNINGQDKTALQHLVTFFYIDLAFSGDENQYFAHQYSLLDKVMDFRTGIPISLAIVFQTLARLLGFSIQGVNFPGHFLLRVDFADDDSIYIDPNNGNMLNHNDLESLYFRILGDIEQQQMPPEALLSANCEETVVRLLHNLKASFINTQDFQLALRAVELLVSLCPNDPYERRDRGLLLQQLDCTQVAIADYQYFIRQCPKDPDSPLLAAQVKQLAAQRPEVFH